VRLWTGFKLSTYIHTDVHTYIHTYIHTDVHTYMYIHTYRCFFQCHHMSLMDFVVSPPVFVAEVWTTSEVGMPMRCSYVVPMRWMVIHEYEIPGGALNLNSTKLPRPWSPLGSSLSRKNPHGRTRNRTRDLMINSQKLWLLDHIHTDVHAYIYTWNRWILKCVIKTVGCGTSNKYTNSWCKIWQTFYNNGIINYLFT
jgi:hypothetical protein